MIGHKTLIRRGKESRELFEKRSYTKRRNAGDTRYIWEKRKWKLKGRERLEMSKKKDYLEKWKGWFRYEKEIDIKTVIDWT